jgi:hypothetical protein
MWETVPQCERSREIRSYWPQALRMSFLQQGFCYQRITGASHACPRRAGIQLLFVCKEVQRQGELCPPYADTQYPCPEMQQVLQEFQKGFSFIRECYLCS